MKLPILVYHKVAPIPAGTRYPKNYVTPEQYDTQLAHLRWRGYRTITFADYLAYRRGAARLPPRPIIITFDDGYRSVREIAVPLLRRHAFVATIFLVAGALGKTNAWDPDDVQEPLLDGDEVRALGTEGFEFGSHTLTHARLPTLDSPRALAELTQSRTLLSALLGKPVTILAYPYGACGDETRHLAAEAGYAGAANVRRRMNVNSTDAFELRRSPVTTRTSARQFAWDLVRLHWFYGP